MTAGRGIRRTAPLDGGIDWSRARRLASFAAAPSTIAAISKSPAAHRGAEAPGGTVAKKPNPEFADEVPREALCTNVHNAARLVRRATSNVS